MPEMPTIESVSWSGDSSRAKWLSIGTPGASGDYLAPSRVYDGAMQPMVSALTLTEEVKDNEMAENRRIVQVFVVDPDERVPVGDALLHSTQQEFTDATDQELFFGLDIRSLLDNHNIMREQVLDKEASRKSGRDVFLEKARIRDLKMVVVTIASF